MLLVPLCLLLFRTNLIRAEQRPRPIVLDPFRGIDDDDSNISPPVLGHSGADPLDYNYQKPIYQEEVDHSVYNPYKRVEVASVDDDFPVEEFKVPEIDIPIADPYPIQYFLSTTASPEPTKITDESHFVYPYPLKEPIQEPQKQCPCSCSCPCCPVTETKTEPESEEPALQRYIIDGIGAKKTQLPSAVMVTRKYMSNGQSRYRCYCSATSRYFIIVILSHEILKHVKFFQYSIHIGPSQLAIAFTVPSLRHSSLDQQC